MMSTKDADLIGSGFPVPMALTLIVDATQMMQNTTQNFCLHWKNRIGCKGEDVIGLLHYQLLKAGHFCNDQGACKMIAAR